MTLPENRHALDLSRRKLLHGAAVAAGGGAFLAAGMAGSTAAAQSKVSQKLANYQNTPHGDDRCDNCTQWDPPSSCKLVEGVISPAGWCSLYAPKPKS